MTKFSAASSVTKFVNDKFNKEFVVTLLSDSFYDSPWFRASLDGDDQIVKTAKENTTNTCREDVWADVLLNGGTLLVEDVEEDEQHSIDLNDLKKAFVKLMLNYPHHYANIIEETYDFYDADAVIQIAVFGDVIYG